MSVLADNFATIDGIRYKLNNDATASVWFLKEFKNDDGILSIPASIIVNDTIYEVNTLTSSLGLTDSVEIHSIVIPASITHVNYGLSCDFPQLTSITVEDGNPVYDSRENCNAIIETKTNTLICGCKNTIIPHTIDTIGYGAFYGCKGLTEIAIPLNVSVIGTEAFAYSGLKQITISSSVHKIHPYIVINCDSLSSITVEEGNPVYDSRDNCNAIIETKTNTLICGCKNTIIPHTIDTIGYGAFRGCKGLTEIAIPLNVSVIGKKAFSYSGLKRVLIPYGVKTIKEDAFTSCNQLKTVFLSNTVTNLCESAFSSCSDLEFVYLPNSLTNIESKTFAYCKRLKSIYVPNNVKEIGNNAFFECDSLEFVMLPYNVGGISKNLFSDIAPLTTFVLSVPNTTSQLAKFDAPWWDKITSVVIEDGVKEIEDYTFKYLINLKNITIPASVKTFGYGALFYYDANHDTLKVYTANKPRAMEKSFYEDSWAYKGYHKKDVEEKIKSIVVVRDNELAYYQPFSSYSVPLINQQLIDWVEQKEGERQEEWKLRVTEEAIKAKRQEIYKTIEADYISHRMPNYKPSFSKEYYLPEEQNFLFKEKTLGNVKVHVPNREAEEVDKNWNEKSFQCTYFIQNDSIRVEKLTITLPNGKSYTTK